MSDAAEDERAENVTPLPNPTAAQPADEDSAPEFIRREAEGREPNPQTPTLLSALDNPAIRAVFEAQNQYRRAWLDELLDEYGRAVVAQQGELDLDALMELEGDAFAEACDVEARRAFHTFIETCHARKVQGRTNPELLKADGAEFERVKIFGALAKWSVDV